MSGRNLRRSDAVPRGANSGFTLIELLITLIIAAVAVAAVFAFTTGTRKVYTQQNDLAAAQEDARTAVDMITRDLRSAGYGTDQVTSPAQPAFAYINRNEIIIEANLMPYPDTSSAHHGGPTAFQPTGNPTPATLTGGFAIGQKYTTGAELIRYSLDVNNDGLVNAADRSDPLAREVLKSSDPSAYVLVRQVFGDSSGAVPTSGNNGGSVEPVAVVHVTNTSSLFNVYINNSSTAYDWAGGAVASANLDRITRVDLHVTTATRRADAQGNFRTISMGSTITTMRNKPQGTAQKFTVDGYVYSDVNKDLHRDVPPDSGVLNAVIRLGASQVTKTNAAGYYSFNTIPGAFTLSQTVPAGFAKEGPDTFTVNVTTANISHNFADTAVVGGTLVDSVYLDTNGNGTRDTGEPGMANVTITAGSGYSVTTDSYGGAAGFLPVGTFSALATGPDTTSCTTTNPQTVVMTSGATVTRTWGFKVVTTAYVKGVVFRDSNKDGTQNSGETGMSSVWVAVYSTTDGSVVGYTNTDASGNYLIQVTANEPAHTPPYRVEFAPPAGFYPTTATSQGPYYVAATDTIGPYNFGANQFTVITLNASNVLSLGTADLLEKDWSGNDNQWATKSHRDIDLVLGSQHVSSSNLSMWFNQYSGTPYFNANPDYSRDATSNVLSVAPGQLDNTSPTVRDDIVTGLNWTSPGNISVWLNQNSSGNLGYLPTSPTKYTTQDHGDVYGLVCKDIGGSSDVDFMVGTATATNSGSLELWLSGGGATPTFTRDETWTTGVNGIPVNTLGSVKTMILADFNGDGWQDLLIGTKTGNYTGTVVLLKGVSRTQGNRFVYQWSSTQSCEFAGIAAADVDQDGILDIVAAGATGASSGKVYYWRGSGAFGFTATSSFDVGAQVCALAVTDFGGDVNPDIVVGTQGSSGAYTGGTSIYYVNTGGVIATQSSDPSGGSQPYWTPAIATANFNYGVQPSTPSAPYLTDLATAIKSGSTTGAVVIYVR